MPLSFIFYIPKFQLTLALLLIFLTALIAGISLESVMLLITSLGFTAFFDLLFTLIRKRAMFIPYAAFATGLIIALLVDPHATWYQIAIISAIAMGTKNFLRIAGRHVFNPAAIGLFVGGILFHQYVAWWGASFQSLATTFSFENLAVFSVVLLPILISGIRMRRLPAIVSFLIANTLLAQVVSFNFSAQWLLSRVVDTTTLFFTTVMLPEPMTSPINKKRQVLYGLTIATIVFIIPQLPFSENLFENGLLPDLFLPALLIGNILFFAFR